MDMRLQTTKYSIAGKEYELRCNMNVLAEVQEMNGEVDIVMQPWS